MEIDPILLKKMQGESEEFKKQIADYLLEGNNEINELQASIDNNPELDIIEKESIYECAECRHVYAFARSRPMDRCPRCGHLNEAVRT